jgi:hypothetical protein
MYQEPFMGDMNPFAELADNNPFLMGTKVSFFKSLNILKNIKITILRGFL